MEIWSAIRKVARNNQVDQDEADPLGGWEVRLRARKGLDIFTYVATPAPIDSHPKVAKRMSLKWMCPGECGSSHMLQDQQDLEQSIPGGRNCHPVSTPNQFPAGVSCLSKSLAETESVRISIAKS